MVFDILSFLAGIAAGGLTGALAGILYSLEKTADLQERVRHLARQIDALGPDTSSSTDDLKDLGSTAKVNELRRELDAIHEEIRRMYKRSAN
jgi:gas vesicle protein